MQHVAVKYVPDNNFRTLINWPVSMVVVAAKQRFDNLSNCLDQQNAGGKVHKKGQTLSK